MKLTYPKGSTPLDGDLLAALIPALVTQGELNEFEAANISDAALWARRSRKLPKGLLAIAMLQELHRRMFDRTWRWAGKFRTMDTNIGVPWPQIAVDVKNLCDDTVVQMQKRVYSRDEIAVRFHHRLVVTHPFPNGNGRHARLAADILVRRQGGLAFPWGSSSLGSDGAARREYLASLKEADGGNLERLIRFARSRS